MGHIVCFRKACQISLTHATRIVDFNGVQVKGYFLKASVCKGEAINAQSTDKTRAMWPSQGDLVLSNCAAGPEHFVLQLQGLHVR